MPLLTLQLFLTCCALQMLQPSTSAVLTLQLHSHWEVSAPRFSQGGPVTLLSFKNEKGEQSNGDTVVTGQGRGSDSVTPPHSLNDSAMLPLGCRLLLNNHLGVGIQVLTKLLKKK